MFEEKDGNKLELQTPDTMKFFGGTKKFIDKTNRKQRKVPSLELVEVFSEKSAIQQIININITLKYYLFFHAMALC